MRAQPNRNYVSNDVVMTPTSLADALVDRLQPEGRILEPCAGNGAFVVALQRYGTVRMCETEDLGFTFWTERVDWIVTNPPWSNFAMFLRHALGLAHDIAFLVSVNHFWTKRRVRDVQDAEFGYRRLILCDWPVLWPSSGFQLGCMHLTQGYRGPCVIEHLASHGRW